MILPGFERTLIMPAVRIRKLPGGVEVEISDRRRRGHVHKARAHPGGVTSCIRNPARRDGGGSQVPIPYPASGYCHPCASFTCEGARYALAALSSSL